jgi:hypothetical protein
MLNVKAIRRGMEVVVFARFQPLSMLEWRSCVIVALHKTIHRHVAVMGEEAPGLR